MIMYNILQSNLSKKQEYCDKYHRFIWRLQVITLKQIDFTTESKIISNYNLINNFFVRTLKGIYFLFLILNFKR